MKVADINVTRGDSCPNEWLSYHVNNQSYCTGGKGAMVVIGNNDHHWKPPPLETMVVIILMTTIGNHQWIMTTIPKVSLSNGGPPLEP